MTLHLPAVMFVCCFIPMPAVSPKVIVSPNDLRLAGATVQAAGMPVLLEVSVSSSGEFPMRYWCDRRIGYPNAADFRVSFIDSSGHRHETVPSNIPCPRDGLLEKSVRPFWPVKVPLAISSLPPGRYVFHVRHPAYVRRDAKTGRQWTEWPQMEGSHDVPIVIRDDAALAGQMAQSLVAQVAAGDEFATATVAEYMPPGVVEGLVAGLLNDDARLACNAAEALLRLDPHDLPRDSRVTVAKAIERAHGRTKRVPKDVQIDRLIDALKDLERHIRGK